MRLQFSTDTRYLNTDLALLVGRISIALLMLSHGLPKMQMLFSEEIIAFPAVLGLSPATSLALAAFSEVVCSLLILVGLGTRLASVPLIITMIVAVFYIHHADVFAKKELGVIYLAMYVVLFLAGSGRYSLDQVISRRARIKYPSRLNAAIYRETEER